jgi:hypothetical protein
MCNSQNQIDQSNLVAALQKIGNSPAAAAATADPISCIVAAVTNNVGNPVGLVLALLACGLSLTSILTCISKGISNPATLLSCLLGNVPVPVPGS